MIDRRKFLKDTVITTGAALSYSILPTFGNGDDNLQFKKSTTHSVKPFLHGVASGDPLSSRVIIWTKINPEKEEAILINWAVSKDEGFTQVIQSGEAATSSKMDYSVKIDVQGLSPSTSYYYRFILDSIQSPVGRTKTAPSDSYENIQLAVVSCTDYSAGYYNALARIAERKDLNAVVHLGDYIYEDTERSFDPQNHSEDDFESTHFNRTREWWLHYYRRRYSINRLDTDLQAAHQAHPFISIWDDHEIANNAWKDGAQGHDVERDGEWEIRKSAAKQAYAEWMPIRGDATKIYRSVRFGKMAELILLDTRLEGRERQIYESSNPEFLAPNRTILGKEQKQWLFDQLSGSPCQWKLIGNQVIFSEINVKWAAFGGQFNDKVIMLENTLLDYWEGYPAERDKVINYIDHNKIDNVVILSASMHCALAFDVTSRATMYSRRGKNATYDPSTGKGSIAVEFAAPSITSANFDEKMESFYANTFQSLINKKLPLPLGYNPNPHLKFADLQRHGYFILQLTKEKAEARFYFVGDLMKRTKEVRLSEVWHTKAGKNKLEKTR
jgi:alkaline phosphatase D